mmetsp:Transcript_14786/g.24165  ORF Transcript_14786/g.24165 Transcript_14786/m.24165 type:complete len:608 (+) Transcript_14786:187-2010(+)
MSKTPVDRIMYLGPGGSELIEHSVTQQIQIPQGCTRVVCISDTHNEHHNVSLPWGHLLVHAGDILTESGQRYVKYDRQGNVKSIDQNGVALFERFSSWLVGQPHPFKAVVGGNHDWVLAALGPDKVRQVFAQHDRQGQIAYLQHENASVGGLKIFGSPYGHWSSHNNAFKDTRVSYDAMEHGTQIMVTHMPPILRNKEKDHNMINAIHRADAMLHVGGHCHWAHGVYHTSQKVPCVVASVCESVWKNPLQLSTSFRADKMDRVRGGYNIYYPPIVCDIPIPPPEANAQWEGVVAAYHPAKLVKEPSFSLQMECDHHAENNESLSDQPKQSLQKPSIICFLPETDLRAAHEIPCLLQPYFDVDCFSDAAAAASAVQCQAKPYAACIAKLGSRNNHCRPLLSALRSVSPRPVIVIHSASASRSPTTQRQLFVLGVKEVVSERFSLMTTLRPLLVPISKPAVLCFLPTTDPAAAEEIPRLLQPHFHVDCFSDATAAATAVLSMARPYSACLTKLGSRHNHCRQVLAAFQQVVTQGRAKPPIVVLHSSTVANLHGRGKLVLNGLGESLVVGGVDSQWREKVLQELYPHSFLIQLEMQRTSMVHFSHRFSEG